MVIQITEDCPAFPTYKGCGKAVLVTYDDIPYQLIYLPEDGTVDNTKFEINKTASNSKVYLGMASCYEFVVEKRLD